MSSHYLDDYLPVIAIDTAVEEKTRITEMANTTLHKLQNVIQQMKNWRDDSARLKSNIWRMKMALREEDKNKNDNQQIDPLILHQRTEINRLEQVNEALGDEVTTLKCALAKAEEDIVRITEPVVADKIARIKGELTNEKERPNHEILRLKRHLKKTGEESQTNIGLDMQRDFRDKLREFARDDRVIEIIFANSIGRIVETVVNLSGELVTASEDLYKFKTKNKNLHFKLDRLRAMLRLRCGGNAEYRKRIGELNNLAEQLMIDMGRLQIIRENANYSENIDVTDISDVVTHVECLMNDLRNNLKCDREAMIAAGDPDCLSYMKKVANLKVNLKVLVMELKRSNASVCERKLSREDNRHERYSNIALLLNHFLREIDIEIDKLKIKPMDKYCRVGGVSGSRYMMKVVELENMVKRSSAMIAVLQRSSEECVDTTERTMKELEDSIKQLCCKIKDFEILDDRSSLRERIGDLEVTIVQFKTELIEKNDLINKISKELASVRLTSKGERNKCEEIIADMRQKSESLKEDVNKRKREISELSRKRVHSEQRVAEMRLMKVEIDAVRKKLQDLHDDKETLLEETEKMRNILREKDKAIANIITQGNTLKEVLGAEVKDLKIKLEIASDENVKLKSIIEGLEERQERERLDKLKSSDKQTWCEARNNGDHSRQCARNLRDELDQLKTESKESKISLNEANKQIDYLKGALDKAAVDRMKLENEISDLKSNEESLTYRLNVQTSAGEETLREYERMMEENKTLESKVKHLQNEKEQLKAKLSELRYERGLLDRSMDDANNKCAALQDQVNKFKSERNGLREKISERKAAAGNLKFELERARTELEDAIVKMAHLKSENSRLADDFDVLSARQTETEDRVRMLLTEKNELTTRINELNDESVSLRDRLNKAKMENEYFSMKLNKSRIENDEVEAKNTFLQVTCDKKESDYAELKRERDNAMQGINEISSECKALGDQLRIQQIKYETMRIAVAIALYHENVGGKSYLKKINTQYPLVTVDPHEREFADSRNKAQHKQDYSDAAQTGIKVEIGERKDDEIEFKAESDMCSGHDNKAKIKDKPKGGEEQKRLRTENKALKLELANLRSLGTDVAMELKDKFERPNAWTTERNDTEIVGCILKRHEITSVCYKREIRDRPGYIDDSKILQDKKKSSVSDIDQLEVENSTLKIEVDILRSNLLFNLMDGKKTKADLSTTTEEIQALKLELMNLRDEKAALRSRLEMFKQELNGLKSERLALKDELVASRKSNFDFRVKANDLGNANEKLIKINIILKKHLQYVLRGTNISTISTTEIYNQAQRNYFENLTFERESTRT